jgi:hypothetical protein
VSRLVRLYPAAWRARYEAELRDALALRPLTARDRLGLIRGALDAWLHPELAQPVDGAPVPVGPGSGGTLVLAQPPFPTTTFLGVAAAGSCALAAGLVLTARSWLWGDSRGESILLTVAAVALGLALWRVGSGAILTRLGGVTMVVISLALVATGWWTMALTASLALGAGSLVAGVGALVDRRPDRWTGLLLLVLAAAIAWAEHRHSIRGMTLVLLGYAAVAVRVALPGLRLRRAVIAVAGGVAVFGSVMLGLAATNPWSDHDGYALGCHVDRAICLETADRMAAAMRGHFVEARVLAIELRASDQVWACWADATERYGQCRLGDDGWPTTLPPGHS